MTTTVVIPLFDGITALDAIGPYEVLHQVPDIDVVFAGKQLGPVRCDHGMLGLLVDRPIAEIEHADVLLVPGGPGTRDCLADNEFRAWVRDIHRMTQFTTSVCSGSLVLAAAGLLDGLPATSHYSVLQLLGELGAAPTTQRVVELLPHRVITAAGVSSGIDMALRLVELLRDADTARAAQLIIEHDPQPPVDAGSPEKAGPRILERAASMGAQRASQAS
ncbi:DJ-1/PfpI family protein [Flexivirga meconopsidis]|uniref:DJ-1/PfpI family protein n=1 Tax=Flexivirga meconopsidis TaxID=2977121 RepID=UPI00223FACAA|nr:DJ-1/PfpI family protein [Flexivirga meconopsidis]